MCPCTRIVTGLVALIFTALLLLGCGNKGDLYLAGETTAPAEAAEEEKPTDEAVNE